MKSGLYLKKIRVSKGYTQKKMAQIVGLTQQRINQIENGKSDIGLCRFLDVCKKIEFNNFCELFEN